jgi:hypothetical protein
VRRILLCSALALALPSALAAQSASVLVARGVEAYRNLDYEPAASLFRRALAISGQGALPADQRANAWTYLGATEVFLQRPDSAAAAFRSALSANPRHLPDRLIFPPEVTEVFDRVRRNSYIVRAYAPRDTTVRLRQEKFVARLLASSPHDVLAELVASGGQTVRRLYEGPIRDSLDVVWDGLDNASNPLSGSPLELRVTSRGAAGEHQSVLLRLTTQLLSEDSLTHPIRPVPATQTERSGFPALASLGGGIIAGALAVALPEVISQNYDGGSARFVVGGTLSLAGLFGFLAKRNDEISTASSNSTAFAAWERDRIRIVAENQRRRQSARIRITSVSVANESRENR